MTIVIAGGTGFLGRMLRRRLREEGHIVWLLVRRPDLDAPERQVLWDAQTGGAWSEALEGADALINLCGRSVNCRYNAKNRAEIFSSRLAPTRALGEALQASARPPQVWLNASSATVYRDSQDRDMDEAEGEIGEGFSVEVCQKWEAELNRLYVPGLRKVAMRTAMVMSREPGGAFEAYSALAKRGVGGPMAGGQQFVSWLHEEDFLRAVSFLLENNELSGPVNLSAPGPLPNSDFLAELRAALGARMALGLPEPLLKVGAWFKGTETELVLKSRRVVPKKLLEAGFEFRFPAWKAAVEDLAGERPRPHSG